MDGKKKNKKKLALSVTTSHELKIMIGLGRIGKMMQTVVILYLSVEDLSDLPSVEMDNNLNQWRINRCLRMERSEEDDVGAHIAEEPDLDTCEILLMSLPNKWRHHDAALYNRMVDANPEVNYRDFAANLYREWIWSDAPPNLVAVPAEVNENILNEEEPEEDPEEVPEEMDLGNGEVTDEQWVV